MIVDSALALTPAAEQAAVVASAFRRRVDSSVGAWCAPSVGHSTPAYSNIRNYIAPPYSGNWGAGTSGRRIMLAATVRPGRPRKPRPSGPMAELEQFARRYRPRAARLERALAELRAERDRAISAAAAGGVPVVEIARALDMTHQNVSRILRVEDQ
jgi:hypothetical protein